LYEQTGYLGSFVHFAFFLNPILVTFIYRQYAEFVGSQMKEPVSSVEGKEVRGLPDVVGRC